MYFFQPCMAFYIYFHCSFSTSMFAHTCSDSVVFVLPFLHVFCFLIVLSLIEYVFVRNFYDAFSVLLSQFLCLSRFFLRYFHYYLSDSPSLVYIFVVFVNIAFIPVFYVSPSYSCFLCILSLFACPIYCCLRSRFLCIAVVILAFYVLLFKFADLSHY